MRLIDRPDGIVDRWRIRILDVCAKDVRDTMCPHERSEPRDADRKCRGVTNVETPRIKGVAGQQYSGAPIVKRDARRLMSRNRQHIENASAEVDRSGVGWPTRDPEKRAHGSSVS